MVPHFTEAEKEVHYPQDKRPFMALKPYMLVVFGVAIFIPIGIAWFQYLVFGLPADPSASVSENRRSHPAIHDPATPFALPGNLSACRHIPSPRHRVVPSVRGCALRR